MLEEVINSCKYVIDNAQYVKINYEVLDEFIKGIDTTEVRHWLFNNPYGLLDMDIEQIVNFLVIFEAIDYSFWGEPKWGIETEEGYKDGSDALLYALLKYVKEHGSDFSKVTYEEFGRVLKGNVEIPLLRERYRAVNSISKIINDEMSGNFYKYVKDVTDDRELFTMVVNSFPPFIDERTYKGHTVYMYKLAQLLVSDVLHLRNRLEGIDVDYSHLAGCPDYKIPQTLRALGITEYNEELAEIIDSKKEIEVNSLYEVEIRASMIVVIDYICNKLAGVKAIEVNDYFFLMGRKVKSKVKPYHRCRNTDY